MFHLRFHPSNEQINISFTNHLFPNHFSGQLSKCHGHYNATPITLDSDMLPLQVQILKFSLSIVETILYLVRKKVHLYFTTSYNEHLFYIR